MKMRDSCLKCTERRVGCHGSCEKYLSAKADYETAKEIVGAGKASEKDMDDLKMQRIRKAEKKRRHWSG